MWNAAAGNGSIVQKLTLFRTLSATAVSGITYGIQLSNRNALPGRTVSDYSEIIRTIIPLEGRQKDQCPANLVIIDSTMRLIAVENEASN